MDTNYFRLTVYLPAEDLSGIFDSNGMFEKLWQFSSAMIERGFKVLEASTDEKFLDVDMEKAESEPDKIFLRACANGKPEYITQELNGKIYSAVKVDDVVYIPDRDKLGDAV